MKKLFLMLSIALLAASCSSKPKVRGIDTPLNLAVSEVKGTQLRVTASPEDDRAWFIFGVVSEADFNAGIGLLGEQKFIQAVIDSVSSRYDEYAELFRNTGAAYVATFDDLALYYGESSIYVTGLTPETDYVVIGACVDPNDRTPSGSLQTLKFKTAAISPEPSRMVLKFLIQDSSNYLYYYTKPTLDGKLCRDPYLVDVVSDDILNAEPYCGSLEKYAADWYETKVILGLLDYYLKTDISRNECYAIDRSAEGKGYTVFGAPFNINNKNKLFSYHFIYKNGMITKEYVNDQE